MLSYPNCDLYAGSDETKSVYVWKAGIEQPILTLLGHSSAVNTMLLHSDEAELYSGLKGGMIVLWDLSRSKVKLNLQGHSTVITAMSVYRVNNVPCVLASASGEGKIKLWDLKAKTSSTNIKGHFSQIDALAFSPDFTYLASGAQDGIVKLWDIRMSNKPIKEFSSPEQKAVNCIEFNPCAITFAYGSKDKIIRYWDLENYNQLGQTPFDRLPIEQIAVESNGTNFFCGTNEALKYWTIDSNNTIKLVDMFETGWNKLQSFRCIEGKAVFGLSSFGNKLSYHSITYDQMFKNKKPFRANSDYMADITEDLLESKDSTFYNNESFIQNIKKGVPITNPNSNPIPMQQIPQRPPSNNQIRQNQNNVDEYTNQILNKYNASTDFNNSNVNASNMYQSLGISKFMGNNTSMSSLSISKDESNIGVTPGNESIFIKNAMNLMNVQPYKEPPKQKVPLSISSQDIPKNKMQQSIPTQNNLLVTSLPTSPPKKPPSSIVPSENPLLNKDDVPMEPTKENENILPPNLTEGDHNDFLESNINMSIIKSSNNDVDDTFLDDPIFSLDQEPKETNPLTTNTSFNSFKSSAPMGLDLNQFVQNKGGLDETIHTVSQTNDLPILQEVNSQHDTMKKAITKRFNSIKMVAKCWSESNISSTLNALTLMKDISVINDFFTYAIIARGDISKIPFTLDHSISLLPHVLTLINSKYEAYSRTGCKVGMIFLKLLNDKVTIAKQSAKKMTIDEQVDPFVDERIAKCDRIIDLFKKIFTSKKLSSLCKKVKNKSTCELANSLYTDLEFFLKPFMNPIRIDPKND